MSQRKTERIDLRISPELKAKAETAAEVEGVTVSEWLRAQVKAGWVQTQLESESTRDTHA